MTDTKTETTDETTASDEDGREYELATRFGKHVEAGLAEMARELGAPEGDLDQLRAASWSALLGAALRGVLSHGMTVAQIAEAAQAVATEMSALEKLAESGADTPPQTAVSRADFDALVAQARSERDAQPTEAPER